LDAPELKTNTPRLYPNIEFVWRTDASTSGKATTFPSVDNQYRVFTLYSLYQIGVQQGCLITGKTCRTSMNYDVSGAYLHTTSDPTSPVLAYGRLLLPINARPPAVCVVGQECTSIYGGHVACNALSLDDCETVPLCVNCTETTTLAPVPFDPGSLTPTPPPVNPNVRRIDNTTLSITIWSIVGVVIICLGITAIVLLRRLRRPTTDLPDDETELLGGM
jgi:hypothetical protein